VEAWLYVESAHEYDTGFQAGIVAWGSPQQASWDFSLRAQRPSSPTGTVADMSLALGVGYGTAAHEEAVATTPIGLERWRHAAVTYDGDEARFYLDGNLIAVSALGVPLPVEVPDAFLSIGAGHPGALDPFGGLMDEVRIWNVVRSHEDIRANMARRLSGSEPGLLAYYDFDERGGASIRDRSGNGRHAVLLRANRHVSSEAPGFGAPALGAALRFDGVDDQLLWRYATGFDSESLTVEAWFKVESAHEYDTGFQAGLVAWGTPTHAAWDFSLRADRPSSPSDTPADLSLALTVGYGQNDQRELVATVPVGLRTWHHGAVTYDGDEARLYLDSRLVASASLDVPLPSAIPDATLSIGTGHPGSPDPFGGTLDEVRVWSVARSERDIRATMARRLTGDEDGLLAYYDFDEGSGRVARDASPNRRHLILGRNSGSGTDLADPTWVVSFAPECPTTDLSAIGAPPSADFRRGDADGDGALGVGDAVPVLAWLFAGGPEPLCLDAADANDSGGCRPDLADPVYLLIWLFQGGEALPPPGVSDCAADPTEDAMGCATYEACD
jgi:hypothetical protein